MSYKYLPGFPNHPIYDKEHLLETGIYEHIGEEIRIHALTFIGAIRGFLHRLKLEPLDTQDNGQIVYYPILTPLEGGEVVDVVTPNERLVLVNEP
jgi:hypothetical protein